MKYRVFFERSGFFFTDVFEAKNFGEAKRKAKEAYPRDRVYVVADVGEWV